MLCSRAYISLSALMKPLLLLSGWKKLKSRPHLFSPNTATTTLCILLSLLAGSVWTIGNNRKQPFQNSCSYIFMHTLIIHVDICAVKKLVLGMLPATESSS